jgi:hypothetical protein
MTMCAAVLAYTDAPTLMIAPVVPSLASAASSLRPADLTVPRLHVCLAPGRTALVSGPSGSQDGHMHPAHRGPVK